MPPTTHLVILAISAAIFIFFKRFLSVKGLPDLPPGPKVWPIIGNLLDLCPDGQHPGKFYQKHRDVYGKIDCTLFTLLGISEKT